MIRVILADDHNLVRQGICALLEKADDIEIVAQAENGQEAVDLSRNLSPDVLIMDINMPPNWGALLECRIIVWIISFSHLIFP